MADLDRNNDELSVEELEDVAGGTDTNGNCPCPISNTGCPTLPSSDSSGGTAS